MAFCHKHARVEMCWKCADYICALLFHMKDEFEWCSVDTIEEKRLNYVGSMVN